MILRSLRGESRATSPRRCCCAASSHALPWKRQLGGQRLCWQVSGIDDILIMRTATLCLTIAPLSTIMTSGVEHGDHEARPGFGLQSSLQCLLADRRKLYDGGRPATNHGRSETS